MSALNLLNQPDTFGNYFQATPTPLPHYPPHPQDLVVPTVLYGVGQSGNKKFVRHKNHPQVSRHHPHSNRKPALYRTQENLAQNR